MPNLLSAGAKKRGNAIASERNAIRRRACRSTHFADSRKNQHDLHAVLAGEADRQKRSGNTSPRKTFMLTGISEPFRLMQRTNTRLRKLPSCRAGPRGLSLQGPLGFAFIGEQ